jgi:hypothetical protein
VAPDSIEWSFKISYAKTFIEGSNIYVWNQSTRIQIGKKKYRGDVLPLAAYCSILNIKCVVNTLIITMIDFSMLSLVLNALF